MTLSGRYAPDHDDVYTVDDDGDDACDEDMCCPDMLWLQDAPEIQDDGRPLDWYPTMAEMVESAA
jgi:hypothetical protein